MVSDASTGVAYLGEWAGFSDVAATNDDGTISGLSAIGGWFRRSEVPTPGTAAMIAIALAGMGWSRRRKPYAVTRAKANLGS